MLLMSAKVVAQEDSLKNNFTLGTHILTHGEACGGGLPKGAYEDRSYFVQGRFRLIADYQRHSGTLARHSPIRLRRTRS